MGTSKKFYRYDIVQYATIDVNGDFVSPTFPDPKVELSEYNLVKETPKGHWISYGTFDALSGKPRWVSKTSKKRYAHPTKQEALNSFIKRNEWRIKILQKQVDCCRIAISIAKGMIIN